MSGNEEWARLCNEDEVPQNGVRAIVFGALRIAVYRVNNEFFATDNICPHAFALLSDGWLEDGMIECPLHGALFDIRTGGVNRGPAECDLKTYVVRLVSGQVMALLPSN